MTRFIFCALTLCLSLLGQETARISGIVTDPTGAVVPKAEVNLEDTVTHTVHSIETDGQGRYAFDAIKPGEYRLEVSKAGFARLALTTVLHARDSQYLQLDLKIGSAATSVTTVAAKVEGVSTEASNGVTVGGDNARDLPVNGRSIQALAQLAPGVVQTGNPDGLNANGMRANTNYYMVDGVSANTGILPISVAGASGSGSSIPQSATGSSSNLLSLDAMQEFRVQTSTFAPEFGRSPGAQVTMQSRGGGNDFHGTLYDYYRSEKLSANDWFANSARLERGKMNQQNYGATFGGPAQRDKTYYFASYEAVHFLEPNTAQDSVPDLSTRAAAPAALKPFLDAFPLPNGPAQNSGAALFSSVYSTPSVSHAGSLRLDRTISDTITAFLRYGGSVSNASNRGGAGFNSSNNVTKIETSDHTLTGSVSWFRKSYELNDFKINYTRSNSKSSGEMDTFGGAATIPDSMLFPDGVTSANGSASIMIPGLGGFSKGQRGDNTQNQLNVVFNQTVTDVGHSAKAGVDFRLLTPTYHVKPYSVSTIFSGLSGDSGSLLSGTATTALVSSNMENVYPEYRNFSFYIQDTAQISKDTTITYGLRWDVNPAPGARGGQRPYGLESDYSLSASVPLYATKWLNIAPRFGWSTLMAGSRGHELVFRGGIGVFFDVGYGGSTGAFSSVPYTNSKIVISPSFPLSASDLSAPGLPAGKPYGQVSAADPQYKSPIVYQWNFGLEQRLGSGQLVSVTYAGNAGDRLATQQTYPAFFTTDYSLLRLTTNGGKSSYHALQLQFRRSLGTALQAQAGYTLGHSIDTSSRDTGFGGFALLGANAKAASDFDVRQTVTTNLVWKLPAPKESVLRAALGGWFLSSILTARTGLPFDLQDITTTNSSSSGSSFLFAQSRPNYVGGPVYIEDAGAPGGRRLNPAAFVEGSAGSAGNLGRNALRGFGLLQLDASVNRSIRLTERFALDLRIDGFNVMNHPNFANPSPNTGANLASPNFGVVTQMLNHSSFGGNASYQNGGPRQAQLSMRLRF